MTQHERSKMAAVSTPAAARSQWGQWLILGLFLVSLAGYATLYFLTPLNDYISSPLRYEVLFHLALLPDEFVPLWFGNPPGVTLLDRAPVLAIAVAILTVAGLLGRLLLRLGGVDRGLSRLETLVFSEAVGANMVSLYVLCLGLLGKVGVGNAYLFLTPAAIVVTAATAFWARRWWGSTSGDSRTAPQIALDERKPENKELGKDELSGDWLWLAAPFVLVIVLGGMLPPTDFDVREYHLQAPKEFYQDGKIHFLRHNVYGNMPLGSEMFSLLAMVLLGDWWQGALVGKTVIALFAPLTALALLSAGIRFGSRTVGVIAALIYISIPWIARVSTAGLVEGVAAFYLWTAVYDVLVWRQAAIARIHVTGDRRRDERENSTSDGGPAAGGVGGVILAGFLAGAAVSCKYPAALFVAVPLTAWVWLAGGRPNWKVTALFVLACAAGCAPWFVKNWVLTDNPTYPLLYEVFSGKTRSDANNAQWLNAHLPRDFSSRSRGMNLSRVVWRSEWISPILLPLAALAWLTPGRRRMVLSLFAFFAYVVAAWWLCTHRIDRFWIPALPVVALLAGFGAAWSSSLVWRRVLLATLICGLTGNLLFVVSGGSAGYNAYFAKLEQLRYDANRADFWHIYLNRQVPVGYGVLTVGDAQVFDLEMPVFYNTVFDNSVFEEICKDHGTQRSPAEIRAELVRRRISHVYVHWREINRYRRPGNYGFPIFVKHRLFADLVQAGVLEPPLRHPFDLAEVYAVKSPAPIESPEGD
jgi:4-amino-4-deoxy-L-arabinose transferase-like glycosyltransferase